MQIRGLAVCVSDGRVELMHQRAKASVHPTFVISTAMPTQCCTDGVSRSSYESLSKAYVVEYIVL